MSDGSDLCQGIKLGDHVQRTCGTCKTKAGAEVSLCPKCNILLPPPKILPSFEQAVENALYHALQGQISIDASGAISEAVRECRDLASYLRHAAAAVGLDAAVTFGFPRLRAESDSLLNQYPDMYVDSPQSFLDEQLRTAQHALVNLRQRAVVNPLAALFAEYAEKHEQYSAERADVRAKVGAGQSTSSLEAKGTQLEKLLSQIDLHVTMFGPHGPVWAGFGEQRPSTADPGAREAAEWNALLQVVSSIANFPQFTQKTRSGEK